MEATHHVKSAWKILVTNVRCVLDDNESTFPPRGVIVTVEGVEVLF